MMQRAVCLAVLLALPLMAGCLESDDLRLPLADGFGVGPDGLAPDTYYQFPHPGGPLTFSVAPGGEAIIDLYGADDRRLGRFQLGGLDLQPREVRLGPIDAGDLVMRTVALDGQLTIDTDVGPIDHFAPLPAAVERVVLVDRPHAVLGDALGLLPQGDPVQDEQVVALARPPADLRLLLTGGAEGLEVTVSGPRGIIYETDEGDYMGALPFEPSRLRPVTGTFTVQNVSIATLEVAIEAESMDGELILEATGFSRAVVPTPPQGTDATEESFSYGVVPDQPILFQVHPDATTLFFSHNGTEGDGPAWVSLYDPDDRLVGTFQVPGNRSVQVPVATGGDHVAVARAGTVQVGADRVPADFELHPLEVARQVGPEAPAGQDGEYGVQETTLDVDGVPFALEPASVEPPGLTPVSLTCLQWSSVQVVQGSDILGGGGAGVPEQYEAADLRLRPAPVTLVHDDLGEDGCGRHGVELLGYIRP